MTDNKVSTGGKIVMAFGGFLILGAIFMVSSGWIALIVLLMGIFAIIRGNSMKANMIVGRVVPEPTRTLTYSPSDQQTSKVNKGAV